MSEPATEGWVLELLERVKSGLRQLYGARLEGVFLFGSRARGEAAPDSDVDLAIVLDEIPRYAGEIERTSELIASLALAYDVAISRVFVGKADWQRGHGPFLRLARTDAIAA
jgi:uncharacterized protein